MKRSFGLRFACWTMVVLCGLAAVGAVSARIGQIRQATTFASSLSCVYVVCRRSIEVQPPAKPSDARIEPAVRTALERRLKAPAARRLLASAEILRLILELAFLFTLAVALSRLARGGLFERGTVRGFRRAAAVAVMAAVAEPVAFGLQRLALAPVLTGDLELNFNGNDVFDSLFFAGAAFVVAWALDDGLRKRDELAGYV